MALTISDGGGTTPVSLYRPEPVSLARADLPPVAQTKGYTSSEASYHPQIGPTTSGGGTSPYSAGGQYGIPAGSTLGETVRGQQGQPFDVTLSELATAVYGTRGNPPEGWTAVTDADIAARLSANGEPASAEDVQAWRETFLAGGTQTTEQEFKAEVYTDGQGNYVLSYRGTAEGMPDWMNNFKQGTGFETDAVDKFSGTAVNTAVEFQSMFGNGTATSDNLAITGHSQGGGLASVGSLATGIGAVTFDASGIHPNTLDRMGFAPQQARDVAEGGQIRAYSLDTDLLTQAQESGPIGPIGLAAPDALGTSIVVEPGPIAQHTLAGQVAGIEFGLGPLGQAGVNTLVEALRNSGIPIVDGIGDLAYSALSHNPNVLTQAMIEQQPWQAGYENPSDFGKSLQDMIPDAAKDDYARNTHDLITDIIDVANTDFAQGDYVQGGFSIAGDVTEGFFNSVGDTVSATADEFATSIDDAVPGFAGDVLSGAVSFGGNVVEGANDLVGSGAELLADGAGFVGQKVTDFGGWLLGK